MKRSHRLWRRKNAAAPPARSSTPKVDEPWLQTMAIEPEREDNGGGWRLLSWGLVGVGAAMLSFYAIRGPMLDLDEASSAKAREAANEALAKERMARMIDHNELTLRRLDAAIATLNADRDRTFQRLSALEHGFESVTGSITKSSAQDSSSGSALNTPLRGSASDHLLSPTPIMPPPVGAPAAAGAELPSGNPPAGSTGELRDGVSASADGRAGEAKGEAKPAGEPSATKPAASKADGKSESQAVAITRADKPDAKGTALPKIPSSKPGADNSAGQSVSGKVDPTGHGSGAPTAAVILPATIDAKSPQAVASRERAERARVKDTPASRSSVFLRPPSEAVPRLPAVGRLPSAETSAKPTFQPPVAPEAPASVPRLATASPPLPNSPASDVTPAEQPVERSRFGVELGSGRSVTALRQLWARISVEQKDNLENLTPVVAVDDGPRGGRVRLRLIAGPVDDAAAAARVCAKLTAAKDQSCIPTVFDGQRLALSASAKTTPSPSTEDKKVVSSGASAASKAGKTGPASRAPEAGGFFLPNIFSHD